ncbi:related to ELP2 - 29 kDa subunit of elongator and elongating RNA polymerase II holoenzyme [Melanopsichium pennsylvanicum]|uniref:Elongator complex protein 2 n=2 Tax=Melanopsichium pennsylvanicum TaxID=63383 RepID=A0AAJ5C7W6_9BASI|nr:related to ELP2-29 kDa subunit of elongator and elongating RNA polymerase II holoenzyme [Melanopsichium pennsylvanicum 4]SNX86894.1 related to ELP2 - 29 kDa subunit of elongator and elongating RNA polymerase II holoenzyme [Melanopsichium pennsylvanicum]
MPPQASSSYISAAFNRANHIADWANAPHSVIAYASNKSIAIWHRPGHPCSPGVTQLLATGFCKPITSLKFANLASISSHPCIVAGSAEGAITVWKLEHNQSWVQVYTIKAAHHGSVSALGVLRSQTSSLNHSLIVSGASDGVLKVWSFAHDHSHQPALIQTIDLKGRFPLDLSLLPLPNSASAPISNSEIQLLMALATTTNKIDVFASATSSAPDHFQFQHKLSLEGHDDWVKSLDLCNTFTSADTQTQIDTLMLASASQDASVRLWKIAPQHDTSPSQMSQASSSKDDEFEHLVSKIESDKSTKSGDISTRAHPFSTTRLDGSVQNWAITFDALLVGHDNWVTGVRWHPGVLAADAKAYQPAALLSSSADNSLILWTPSGQRIDAATGSPFPTFDASLLSTGGAQRAKGPTMHHLASSIWLPSQRFGEVGGASNLGFFGALWQPLRQHSFAQDQDRTVSAVVAHGWGGSAHIWTLSQRSAQSSNPQWQVTDPVTGHFAAARSVAWEPCGEFLLSCSDDQTTRLHARPMRKHGQPLDTSEATWHEIARPQSHGYDLHSVSWLDRLNFVSAADEKVLRVFSAPRGFVGTAGKYGLDCATLGSEQESRSASRPVAGTDTLLHLSVDPQIGLLKSAIRHGGLIRQTVERCCHKQTDSFTAIVSSLLFTRPLKGLSFKQIELYLKWLYAQAWSVAVKRGLMLANITILLVPDASLKDVARRLRSQDTQVKVDAELDSNPATIWQQLGVSPEKLPLTNVQQNSFSSIGEDDNKGLVCYPVVALGGTFDHLHVGHKILLTMASLIADREIIVGVTDDAMLAKKSNAHLLEPIEERIASVNAFISLVRLPFAALNQRVVKLEDVAGPAATEADLQALVVTDETISGADFIDGKRKDNGLNSLENWVIGVVGSEGETELKGDAKALAGSKIGSTAIRKWLMGQGPRRVKALETAKRHRISQQLRITEGNQRDATSQHVVDHVSSRPVGASVPPLGLSNRAVFEGSAIEEAPSASGQPIGSAKESLSAVLGQPPCEEQLAVETLWPELEKLYGHGYELLWVCANPSNPVDDGRRMTGGRFVASSCKATSEDHAVVRIHDRHANWRECAVLEGHSLSITRMQWSMDSRFILTCSRDRSWRMYEQKTCAAGERVEFVPFTGERSHARIVWDCAWSNDVSRPYVFATASRDKTIKIFELEPESRGEKPFKLLQTIKLNEAVTAVAFGADLIIAVGKEDGEVEILQRKGQRVDGVDEEWVATLKVKDMASEQINQLAFRPPVLEDGDDAMLASASEDGMVRLTRISGL